ncbi:MAG: HDOD domain-containing protein [Pseudomonadota bacterium]
MRGDHELSSGHELPSSVQSTPMPTVLFVDDDVCVLKGLRRFMRSRGDSWTSRFACGGAEAIEALSESGADLVVTDMRMPGIDGAQLLEWISLRQPGTIRFVLSGDANIGETYRIVGRSHQFLAKPCTPEKLADSIANVLTSRWTPGDLAEFETASFLDRLRTDRVVYLTLAHCLHDEDCSSAVVAEIISTDPGLSARVLQLANSAYFGRAIETASIERAIKSFGLDHLRALLEQGRLGKATNDTDEKGLDRFYGSLAKEARAHGARKTENQEVLDTIYATALFCGLGSIVRNKQTDASVASAAFPATLLGFPRKLIDALGRLRDLPANLDSTDLIDPICSSVFQSYAAHLGGQANV